MEQPSGNRNAVWNSYPCPQNLHFTLSVGNGVRVQIPREFVTIRTREPVCNLAPPCAHCVLEDIAIRLPPLTGNETSGPNSVAGSSRSLVNPPVVESPRYLLNPSVVESPRSLLNPPVEVPVESPRSLFNPPVVKMEVEDSVSGNDESGQLDSNGSQNIHIVEQILDIKFLNTTMQFCVKWFGYNSEFNTWEQEDNFGEMVDDGPLATFWKKRSKIAAERIIACWEEFVTEDGNAIRWHSIFN